MNDLITAVAERLGSAEVPFAVIGAAAMSAHGFPRQTLDFDFLVTDQRVLEAGFWRGLPQSAEIGIGDADDPLVGLVRFAAPAIDVVVGRYRWQAEVLSRAQQLRVGGLLLPVVTLGDLILLKLYAGGYRDAADVRMMLDGADLGAREHIERGLPTLPGDARRLWGEIVKGSWQ